MDQRHWIVKQNYMKTVLNFLYDLTPIAYKNNNITGRLRLKLIN